MRLAKRIAYLTLAAATFSSVSSAYYHFVHFTSRTAPWRALYEKFDLNVLPNKTLTYFVTDQTGVQLAPGDTYVGLISQIRLAGKVWNDVDTSELRLSFGGFAAPATYAVNGKQYVVIAATGGGKLGGPLGDAYVAFALPASSSLR